LSGEEGAAFWWFFLWFLVGFFGVFFCSFLWVFGLCFCWFLGLVLALLGVFFRTSDCWFWLSLGFGRFFTLINLYSGVLNLVLLIVFHFLLLFRLWRTVFFAPPFLPALARVLFL
jgi:hypothetical protein